jgi:hypothetical protein
MCCDNLYKQQSIYIYPLYTNRASFYFPVMFKLEQHMFNFIPLLLLSATLELKITDKRYVTNGAR